ncbi:hypothetical protein IKG24_01180 [Candidatus Saccharibacteria bacterium]|nr:hypothetical protein [Candidatus Saccharibacteria bacterium]
MKKIVQKITAPIMALVIGLGMIAPVVQTVPAYADGEEDPAPAEGAAILTDCWNQGKNSRNGGGIMCVVRLVVDILSVLVGIVGVIGIVVVGIQYLTAGGNEEQTRKAKRRLFEIVIGIMAYVLIRAILGWVSPSFGAVHSGLPLTVVAPLTSSIGV